MKLHFVDTETSHLDPTQGEITELAIISYCMETKSETTFVKKIRMLNPEMANPKSLEIGNYHEYIWKKEGVYFSEIAEQVSDILSTGMIVGHNVKFDYNYILKELSRYNYSFNKKLRITYKTFDTKDLVFEHLYPTLQSTSMGAVRNFFNWDTKDSHTALKDTIDCRNLFFMLNKCSWLKRMYYISSYKFRMIKYKTSLFFYNNFGYYN